MFGLRLTLPESFTVFDKTLDGMLFPQGGKDATPILRSTPEKNLEYDRSMTGVSLE